MKQIIIKKESKKMEKFESLHSKVDDTVLDVYCKASNYFGMQFDLPEIIYNLTGRTAGIAYSGSNKIRLNKSLLLKYGILFINDTVKHECAHLIARKYFEINKKIKPHGKEWKIVMRVLGAATDRCHSFDTSCAITKKSLRRQYLYTCACNYAHIVGTKRHNKLSGFNKYYCKKCKSNLVFVRYMGKMTKDEAFKKGKQHLIDKKN